MFHTFPRSLEREKSLLSPPKYTLQDSGNTNKNKMAAKRVFDLNEASVLKSFFVLFPIYRAHDRMRGLDYHVFYCSHRLLT